MESQSLTNEKKDAARILLPVVMDPENIDYLYELFWSIDDKQFINGIIDDSEN